MNLFALERMTHNDDPIHTDEWYQYWYKQADKQASKQATTKYQARTT